MSKILETLEPFREINRAFPLNHFIKEWKERGGKVIGVFDGNIPEEILYAAGILPVWLRSPSKEIALDAANAHLYIYICSYTRSVLETALKGEYDFLDGVVSCSYCDGNRRLSDVWARYVSSPVIYFLHIPHKMDERAEEFFYGNILEFIGELETTFHVTINDDNLRKAITVYNETRILFQRLYDLRKKDRPPISGAEMIEVYNACNMMPREQFNMLLKHLVEEAETSGRFLEGDVRLLINGTVLHNPEFVEGIEKLGGLVVADSLINGSMDYMDLVKEGEGIDPLRAITSRYLKQFPSPRMYPVELRYNEIMKLIKNFRVEGVITEGVRYCAPYIYDEPRLRERLEQQDIPNLRLDLEYNMTATGQIKTRVQAFLEMIRAKKNEKEGN